MRSAAQNCERTIARRAAPNTLGIWRETVTVTLESEHECCFPLCVLWAGWVWGESADCDLIGIVHSRAAQAGKALTCME